MISWKKRSKSKVRRKFRGSTLISALRLWHEERIRGKTITKHEQMWNLSSDWVCIWVRRSCTLLLRQSIPEQLFCRAASTNYLEQGIDIWINLVFQVTDMTSCKILEWIDYYLHISPCHVAKRRRPANFGSLGAAKY